MDEIKEIQQQSQLDIKDSKRNGRSSLKTCFYRIFCYHPTSADQDKGFAWLVLFWCTVGSAMSTGVLYGTYGPMNIILQKKFDISVSDSSLICSLNTFLWLVTAPIASVLTKKWSCRTVQISGGCMIVIGLGGCALANNIWQVYILYGVIAGLGASFCYVTAPAVLVHHFRELKYMAFAISNLGPRSGTSTWASLSQLMFSSIGFSQTMAVLGLIELIPVVAGLFMTEQMSLDKDEEQEPLSFKSAVEKESGSEELFSDEMGKIGNTAKLGEPYEHAAKERPDLVNKSLKLVQELKILLMDWTVWCLIWNFGLWSITIHGFYFFINDYVVKYRGISETDAALVVSIAGGGSIAACLLNIAISRFEFDRLFLYTPMSSLYGLAMIVMAFTTSGKAMLYFLTAIFGCSYGLSTSNMYAVCYSFHGAELMAILFGFGMCAQGFAGLLTGPICSYLQTHVHHTAGIAFAGGTGVAASIVLIPVIVKRLRNHTSYTQI